MATYYNEIDPYAAEWLRTLILLGHIADGVVDTRSISDVEPYDLKDFTQCHFFAGIGVWSHALRIAGWPDERPVWTGSCPCQPFSSAGRSGGFADERHLWPHFHHLIRECRPGVVFGEQVASKDGLAWLDAVRVDMEGAGYAFGAADLCAAGVGAPHIRQRAFFVAVAGGAERRPWRAGRNGANGSGPHRDPTRSGGSGLVADASGERRDGKPVRLRERGQEPTVPEAARRGPTGLVADAQRERGRGSSIVGDSDHQGPQGRQQRGNGAGERSAGTAGLAGFWSDAEWVWCRDGVWRPHGPESFPLTVAHGASGRVGRLRAYGNAIVAPLAAEFIASFMECWGRVVRP